MGACFDGFATVGMVCHFFLLTERGWCQAFLLMHPAQSFTCLATVGQEYLGSATQVSDSCFPTDATVLGGECKWLEAQGAEGQQQTSVRRSGVQRNGIIDRSPVLHVYASVAEIELFTKFRIRLFDDYEIQSHSVGVDKHSVLK